MRNNKTNVSILLALLTSAACASSAPTDNDSDPDDPTPDQDDVSELKLGSKYELTSKFDVATNMPGTAGAVVNQIIAATDEGSDPAKFIVEQVIAKLPDGSLKNALSGAVPFVSDYLNQRLIEIAPNFVPKVTQMGNMFGDAMKNFGTLSELQIAGQPGALTGVHVVNGVQFTIEGSDIPFMFADYSLQPISANIAVTLDQSGKVTLGQHSLPIGYGKIARIALDEAVLPFIDPTARNLNDLFAHLVNCQAVGVKISEALGLNAASGFESACKAGLNLGAGFIYNKISELDSKALDFQVTGSARGIDSNRDDIVDQLQRGAWAGQLSYDGTPAPLANAIFDGRKM